MTAKSITDALNLLSTALDTNRWTLTPGERAAVARLNAAAARRARRLPPIPTPDVERA